MRACVACHIVESCHPHHDFSYVIFLGDLFYTRVRYIVPLSPLSHTHTNPNLTGALTKFFTTDTRKLLFRVGADNALLSLAVDAVPTVNEEEVGGWVCSVVRWG